MDCHKREAEEEGFGWRMETYQVRRLLSVEECKHIISLFAQQFSTRQTHPMTLLYDLSAVCECDGLMKTERPLQTCSENICSYNQH